MALLVVLVPTDREVIFGPQRVDALARIGITSISLARDEQTTAVILEGWAFDSARPEAALVALGASKRDARTLRPVAHMAVSTARNEGGESA